MSLDELEEIFSDKRVKFAYLYIERDEYNGDNA